jgi:hypothetical protein
VLTRAEIDRMRTGFTARRAAITEQLAEIEAHRRVGQTASMLADVVKARNLAREMLNGHGAALIPAASDEPLESRFYTERNAIDICLKALRNSELPLRAAEAVRWREEHSAEWNRLMKVALITRARLAAVEQRLVAMREEARKHAIALPLCTMTGMLLNPNPLIEFDRAENEALELHIITRRDLTAAKSMENEL